MSISFFVLLWSIAFEIRFLIILLSWTGSAEIIGELGGTLELHSNIEDIETQSIEYKTIDDLINAHKEALNQKHFAYNETPTRAK